MTTLSIDIQREIYTKLTENAPLMSVVMSRVFDEVTQDSPFPYITIGEDIVTPENTDDAAMQWNVSIIINVWTRAQGDGPSNRGRKQNKEILDLVVGALHRAEFVETANNVVTCELVQVQNLLDSDGLTRHGIAEFLFIIEEVL